MNMDRERDDREFDEHARPEPVRERSDDRDLRPLSRERVDVRDRNQTFRVSEQELVALRQIGEFRTIAVEDLMKHAYGGQTRPLRDDLRSLSAQGLLQQRTAPMRRRRGSLEVVVLTKTGKRLLEGQLGASRQALYAGFVKRSEVAHDAAIYKMFHAEKARIEREGGCVRRVVLDYELKRLAYAPLAKARPTSSKEDFAKRQAAVAREYGLAIIKGRLVLPDLRIEYVTRDHTFARVDLELATEHYHGSHLAAKAQAGFRFYVADGSAEHLTKVMEEREITASILSL